MINYLLHLLILINIYIVLSVALQLAVGYTGLMNFGHIAFFGIGAYASTLLTLNGTPFIVAFIASGLVAGCSGYILTWAVRKLKGDYLALTTLGFSFVVVSVLLNWTSLTRGPLGLPGIPRPNIFGIAIASQIAYVVFTGIIAILAYWFFKRLAHSRFGKLLEAIRDNESYATAVGKNTFRMKTRSMFISACFAGLAGSLFAHYINFIDPYSFGLSEIILVFTIIIVAGLASLPGTVEATFLLILIPEVLRFFSLPSSILGPARQMIYALILLGILLYKPLGLRGEILMHEE